MQGPTRNSSYSFHDWPFLDGRFDDFLVVFGGLLGFQSLMLFVFLGWAGSLSYAAKA